ncbi:MAG: hypothetical protein IPG11_16805 [Flavobacteriales bacterium]|nr:hypothetical protein [Flavobacteriales bacterium]
MLVTQGTLLVVSQVIRDELNEREGTDCSCLFIAMMAQVFSGLEYELGNWRWFDLSVSRVKELQHQFPFVVRSSQVSELEVIMKDLIDRATQPRTTTLTLDAYSLIPNKSSLNRDELVHATIDLAQCLFPDIQVQGAQLLLQPNKKRKQEDILLEILLELDEPSHASLIVERWNELVPERPVTIDSVRSVAIRNKELFFSISRDSTYGLRQWERDRPMLKSGTLRDIVEEELEGSHRPLHISELTLAISRYRKDTNSSSVRTNLSLDRSGRFITMPQGFFGLAKRQYPEQRSDLRNIPSSLLRSSVLRKYIGVSLTKLVDYIVDHGKVHRDIVLATVHLLINEGRLILGPDKNIIHVTSDPLESGQAESFNDELPFPEG